MSPSITAIVSIILMFSVYNTSFFLGNREYCFMFSNRFPYQGNKQKNKNHKMIWQTKAPKN
jgi:hypothetical protein